MLREGYRQCGKSSFVSSSLQRLQHMLVSAVHPVKEAHGASHFAQNKTTARTIVVLCRRLKCCTIQYKQPQLWELKNAENQSRKRPLSSKYLSHSPPAGASRAFHPKASAASQLVSLSSKNRISLGAQWRTSVTFWKSLDQAFVRAVRRRETNRQRSR